MSPLVQIVLAGVGTYLIRVSLILLVGRGVTISESTEATLRLIAPAVLCAIVANTLVLDGGEFSDRGTWYVAGAIAAVAAWRWRSAGITMAVGMVAVWMLNLVV